MPNLEELIFSWKRHCSHAFSEHTQWAYERVLRRFADSMPARADHITPEHIERYLSSLFDSGLSGSSVNSHLFALRSFFRWADSDKMQHISRFKTSPPKQNLLKPEQYEQILAVCRGPERMIIELLAHTGLRSEELRTLRKENISGHFLQITGKNNRPRVIPLNRTAQAIVDKENFLKLLKSYRKPDSLTCLCRKLKRRLHNKFHFSVHSFRHFFATQMLRRGCDVYRLSKILGHKNLATTEQYLHLIDSDLDGLTDVLDE